MEYAELEEAHEDQSQTPGPVQDIPVMTLCAWALSLWTRGTTYDWELSS